VFDLKSIKIISGGQSGVDRAALDFALKYKLDCGGYCPKGRLAEDGIISGIYPLTEISGTLYKERTRLNVEISDALLVIYKNNMGRGTELAIEIAKTLNKEYHIIRLPSDKIYIESILKWLLLLKPASLNVAGPRESNDKGIYLLALIFLEQLFGIV